MKADRTVLRRDSYFLEQPKQAVKSREITGRDRLNSRERGYDSTAE